MSNSVLYKVENSQFRNNEPGTRLICHRELRNPHTLSWLDYQAMGMRTDVQPPVHVCSLVSGSMQPVPCSMQNELKSRIFIIFGQTLG